MKRFAFLFFVLTAGLVAAESKPFAFNMGVDTEYLGLFNDLETDVGGVLNDSQLSMNFVGGHVFADISRYVTVEAGVWYGLPGAKAANDGLAHIRLTPANTMLLLDLSAVFKYPIAVGEAFEFSPKIGLDGTYYLLGNFDGSAPSSTLKTAVSPFSFILGADADYTFPNGVFLRLPVDLTYALNSRPASVSGRYIASNTITVSTGLGVGYKLAGFERVIAPQTPKPQAAETPEPDAEKETAPKKLGLAVGGGVSLFTMTADQTMASIIDLELKQTLGHAGFYSFFDISEYFTTYVGILFGIGKVTQSLTSQTDQGPFNKLLSWEIGGEVKYPLPLSDTFTVAPKLGFAYVGYLSGKVGSAVPDSNAKQLYSPMLITGGADCNWKLSDEVFVRVPLEVGYALNTRLPDSFYAAGSATYIFSYTLSFRTGVSLGYRM